MGILKEVRRHGQPILITLRGEPLATVRAPTQRVTAKRLGALEGAMTIHADIVKADTRAE